MENVLEALLVPLSLICQISSTMPLTPNNNNLAVDSSSQGAFCSRICLFPCQCSLALMKAVTNCDCGGALKVIFCCPCRTFCDWCPTRAEQEPAEAEPDEIPYNLVFEMEKSRRAKLGQAVVH